MSIVKRFISYQIPDSSAYNQIIVYDSATETGAYSLVESLAYVYPTRATEYDSIDTTKWYKIRFYDSVNAVYSPYSQAFFGGQYDNETPFACITTTFDGGGFATVSGFYNVTNIDNTQVPVGDVATALRTARAYIDLITNDQSPYKYSRDWNTDISKRKYNAQIELIRSSEIYFAAALVYQDMADDRTLAGLSGTISTLTIPADLDASTIVPYSAVTPSTTAGNISIGQTSISDSTTADAVEAARFNLEKQLSVARYNNEKNLAFAEYNDKRQVNRYIQEAEFFTRLSVTYATKADALINLFKPTNIPVTYGLSLTRQKFLSPTSIFAYTTTGTSTTVFSTNVAGLTGLGDDINGVSYALSAANMVANSVNGVLGLDVYPTESATTLIDATLVVNGVTYWLDDWTDHTGVVGAGKAGTTGGVAGFSINFNTGAMYIELKWNFTLANGGFDLVAGDDVTLTYWTV